MFYTRKHQQIGLGGLCSKSTYNFIPLFSHNCPIIPERRPIILVLKSSCIQHSSVADWLVTLFVTIEADHVGIINLHAVDQPFFHQNHC